MDNLRNKAFAFYTLCVLSCVLCLMPGLFSVASAQEVKVYIKEDSKDKANFIEVRDDEIIADEKIEIIEVDVPIAEDEVSEIETQDEKRDTDEDRPGGRSREGQPQRDRQLRPRSGERFPPEVRRMMEEEGISPEELMKNPELRREFRERVERMRRERGEGSEPDGESPERDRRQRRARGREPADEGLRSYLDVIVKKNLFHQLGSGGEERKTSYALTAVISNASGGSDDKAIIEERGGGRSYYVSEGDTFANEVKVEDINEEVVELERSGEKITLKLGEGTQGGRQGGGRGRRGGGRAGGGSEGRPGGEDMERGSDQRGGGDFDPGEIPPFVRRILEEQGISIEDLKGDPGLRERLQREFEGRARRGERSGGERPRRVEVLRRR